MSGRARALIVALAAGLLVAGYFVAANLTNDEVAPVGALDPVDTIVEPGTPGAPDELDEPQRAEGQAAPRTVEVPIDGRGEPRTIRVFTGEPLRLVLTGDQPGEAHIHGFDVTRQVAPGEPARVTLRPDAEGIFEIENHATGEVVGRLEVRPRP